MLYCLFRIMFLRLRGFAVAGVPKVLLSCGDYQEEVSLGLGPTPQTLNPKP